MIRFIAFIITALLPTTLTAQEEMLRFDPAEWDFGTILETDGRVSHTFTGENVGDSPLVILDVVTSCGCTVPAFSKQPVLPGEKTSITVTYDPTNRPGIFDKELWVYSSERRKIASLHVRGNVTPRAKSLEELYPVDAGNGLRLASPLCALPPSNSPVPPAPQVHIFRHPHSGLPTFLLPPASGLRPPASYFHSLPVLRLLPGSLPPFPQAA